MRMGIPFASIGFLNSDEGVFPEYIRNFLMTAFTLVTQLCMMNLSILVIINRSFNLLNCNFNNSC